MASVPPMAENVQRLHAIVTGIVQGVNYRYFTRSEAARLGVSGWVRNLPDGSVEVMAEGARPNLDRLLDFLRRGPPPAQVEAVDEHWSAGTGEFRRFEIRY